MARTTPSLVERQPRLDGARFHCRGLLALARVAQNIAIRQLFPARIYGTGKGLGPVSEIRRYNSAEAGDG
jgi:hypothetical protein